MNVDLSGEKLATHLAHTLTDLEFELLVRERIRAEFNHAHLTYPQFSESHNSCRFVFEWNDKCQWIVGVGSTYRDTVSNTGEVLSACMHHVVTLYEMQTGNKLSKLLPAPECNEENE